MTTIQGRKVSNYVVCDWFERAGFVMVNDLITVGEGDEAITGWVIGLQRSFGYVDLMLDTPGQPTTFSLRNSDLVGIQGHDYAVRTETAFIAHDAEGWTEVPV